MPESILTKAPSAELKPNQKDQDTLPPYDLLDWVLEALVEQQLSVDEILALKRKDITRSIVEQTARMLATSEYKRRQAPPGVKISRMAFGRDRRYPLTNKYQSGA
jgi:NAD+ synthase